MVEAAITFLKNKNRLLRRKKIGFIHGAELQNEVIAALWTICGKIEKQNPLIFRLLNHILLDTRSKNFTYLSINLFI